MNYIPYQRNVLGQIHGSITTIISGVLLKEQQREIIEWEDKVARSLFMQIMIQNISFSHFMKKNDTAANRETKLLIIQFTNSLYHNQELR